jgi:myo-inositol-1-phosphate synthase
MRKPDQIFPATGRLGILLPGMGAVATTAVAGVHLVRKGLAEPIGSLTQMGTVRLGKRTEKRVPTVRELLPLAALDDLVFGGWDIFDEDAYETALRSSVLTREHLELVREDLQKIRPMRGAFYPQYVKRLHGTFIKEGDSKADIVEQLREDISRFREENACDRLVMIWCGSTEIHTIANGVHESVVAFERGLQKNDDAITASQLYAWAAIKEGVPFANGAPNLTVDFPAAWELAREHQVPLAGKDFKTGQTLLKTVIAPGLKARMLGVRGWFSTNILGNRDGEVLDDPDSFKAKEATKMGVLDYILQPHLYQQLYGDLYHKVTINYYPPRGDEKEGWDNIDLFGWLGYPMQIKVDFLCRDSILAAPIVLDLALLLDLARRAGFSGIQEWLSFYFKCPMTAPDLYPEHDLFIQLMKLKNTMRWMVGETPVTHLGHEYYD